VTTVERQQAGQEALERLDELREKTILLELFAAVALAASDSSTPDEALGICLDEICGHTGWPVGHVYQVLDGSLVPTDVWHLEASADLGSLREETRPADRGAGAGLAGRALATRRPVWVADLAVEPLGRLREVARAAGMKAGVAFPATVGGQVVAVLEFFSPWLVEPDSQLLAAMEQIGSQVGRVIERKRAEEELHKSEAVMRSVVDNALDCVVTADYSGRIIDFNPAAERTFGYRSADVVGHEIAECIIPSALRERHRRGLAHYLETGEGPVLDKRMELTGMRADGSEFPMELSIHAIEMEDHPIFTAYLRDITDRRKLEGWLKHRAYHDSLTDLANRALFVNRTEHALARSDRRGDQHSVIYLDLDDFKSINDSMGHACGDELLIEVARRLRKKLRPGDTLARLGGDEFAVLLEDTDTSGAGRVAERVVEGLRAPVHLGDREVQIHASLGIATAVAGTSGAEDLLRHADEAMYTAKSSGKRDYAIFEGEIDQQ
jgi:diguanylate cyclase (GGDEF)-like protein/PAS domain S-box-containing protein